MVMQLYPIVGARLDKWAELNGLKRGCGWWIFRESDASLRRRLIDHKEYQAREAEHKRKVVQMKIEKIMDAVRSTNALTNALSVAGLEPQESTLVFNFADRNQYVASCQLFIKTMNIELHHYGVHTTGPMESEGDLTRIRFGDITIILTHNRGIKK